MLFNKKETKDLFGVASVPAIIASLCCLSPVILVAFGVATVSFASSLADILYGQYKWYFRLVGFISLVVAFIVYSRRKMGVCSLDDVVRRRNELINKFSILVIIGTGLYLFFLYVVVHYIGVFLNIWK